MSSNINGFKNNFFFDILEIFKRDDVTSRPSFAPNNQARPGWELLTGENANQPPGVIGTSGLNVAPFYISLTLRQNKLECLSFASVLSKTKGQITELDNVRYSKWVGFALHTNTELS
jgi:hypothetical protein